jgi:MoaA/NifB/PqqE/SkfB family radical SAM enzyme
MLAALSREAKQRLSVGAVDLALQIGPVRRLALGWGERKLHRFYMVVNGQHLPLGVQELRYLALTNLLRGIEKMFADGRISAPARRGLLRVFVGEVIMGAHDNLVPFLERHGFEPPSFLVVSPTARCNLFCEGCYAASSSKDLATLPWSTLVRLLREKRDDWGSHFTVISGGEPFLYRSEGKEFLDLLRELQDQYFMVYTNGTLIDDALARRLARAGNVTPAISVEGFEAETDARRGKGVFRRIERAMRALRDAGVPFGISVTATRKNAEVILNDALLDHYFDELGALFAWVFHYMPIGRSSTLDRMLTPEQRKRLLDRQIDLMRNRGLFFIDFWNGGPMTAGCMSAGRDAGYFYVDWNGNIAPCVFVPYAVDNVKDMQRDGRPLSSVLHHPLFEAWREWQTTYRGDGGGERGNLFRPCPMRDHHRFAHDAIVKFGAKPLNEDAARALEDPAYRDGLVRYGEELKAQLDPVWQREMIERKPPSRVERAPSRPEVAAPP